MKTKLTFAMLFLSVTLLNSQYFFDGFTDAQKLDTAHAYLMVSEQFSKLGDKDQAQRFKDMALFIYPEILLQDQEKLETLVAAPEKTEPVRTIPEGPDRSPMIRYYFSKLLRSITTEDMKTADSLMADRLYLPQFEGGIDKRQQSIMIKEVDRMYNLSSFSPTDLYKLDTISVRKVEEGTYYLTIEGADNDALYKSGITFFTPYQTFRFRHFDKGWKIDKIISSF